MNGSRNKFKVMGVTRVVLIIVDDIIFNSNSNFRKRSRVSHDTWTERSGVCESALRYPRTI